VERLCPGGASLAGTRCLRQGAQTVRPCGMTVGTVAQASRTSSMQFHRSGQPMAPPCTPCSSHLGFRRCAGSVLRNCCQAPLAPSLPPAPRHFNALTPTTKIHARRACWAWPGPRTTPPCCCPRPRTTAPSAGTCTAPTRCASCPRAGSTGTSMCRWGALWVSWCRLGWHPGAQVGELRPTRAGVLKGGSAPCTCPPPPCWAAKWERARPPRTLLHGEGCPHAACLICA